MSEREFIKILKRRAGEQEKLTKSLPFPNVFFCVGLHLGTNPWKILIPIAFIITFISHLIFGEAFDGIILKLFGKL